MNGFEGAAWWGWRHEAWSSMSGVTEWEAAFVSSQKLTGRWDENGMRKGGAWSLPEHLERRPLGGGLEGQVLQEVGRAVLLGCMCPHVPISQARHDI